MTQQNDLHKKNSEEVQAFKRGISPVLAEYWKGEFGCKIVDGIYKVCIFYFSSRKKNTPVPGGRWMGYWDSDLKVSKKKYDALSTKEKAYYDCVAQVEKYVPHQYYFLYAAFYYPKEFNKWRNDMIQVDVDVSSEWGNNLWKQRLKGKV